MEQSDERKDMGAQKVGPEAPSRRNLFSAVGISLVLAFGLIVLLSSSEYSPDMVEIEIDDHEPQKMLVVQPPKDEVMLMNFDDFAQTYRLAEEITELEFLAEMMDIAQHNLATLSGLETYYKRQSPFKSRLSDKYKLYSWTDLPLDMLSNFDFQDGEENAVSQSAAELKKTNVFSKWFQGFTKKEADFEIPDFPLDQQPDPERITHIDADLRGCLDGIKDQGKCGACYAFSWLSLAEWHHCKQSNDGQLANFSEQHIVDCGHKAHLRGCVEGKLTDTKDFSQAFGIHLEKDYPYTSRESACNNKMESSLRIKVKDFKRIKVEREQFEQTLLEQPILLEVHLPADINSYSSGIHPGHNCNPEFGHGMLLVGHGRQEGRPYWLLRNSMGKRWGENGYLRISRDMPNMGQCFKSAFVAKIKFSDLSDEKYADFYDSLKFEPALDNSRKRSLITAK